MNMSYCMYENTSIAMDQVLDDLEERVGMLVDPIVYEDEVDDVHRLSKHERWAATRLYDQCREFVRLMEVASGVDDTLKNL